MDPLDLQRIRRVLVALAALSPSAAPSTAAMVIPTDWFRWLNLGSVGVFQFEQALLPAAPLAGSARSNDSTLYVERDFGERLAAISQVRDASDAIRVGWLFVAGSLQTADGRRRRVFQPLISVPVRVWRQPIFGPAQLVKNGDATVTELVRDADTRHDLESRMQFGGGGFGFVPTSVASADLLAKMPKLKSFAIEAATAAGLKATALIPASESPEQFMRADHLVVVAGIGVYVSEPTSDVSRASSFRAWSEEDLGARTAMHSLYTPEVVAATLDDEVESALHLTPTQRTAVATSRHAPITLVSGAPGTGKSHTLAAVALDAVARGENVLVVAKTNATVDALIDLLQRAPGPDPVVFGSNERREALADRLSSGGLRPINDEVVDNHRATLRDAVEARDGTRRLVVESLEAERRIDAGGPIDSSEAVLDDVRRDAAEVARLLAQLDRSRGWQRARRRRRTLKHLRATLRVGREITSDVLRVQAAEFLERFRGRDLVAAGGLNLDGIWDALATREEAARVARGALLSAECRSYARLDAHSLGAVAALATALRSGRSARREQLRRLRHADVNRALPLWIGTLADVDDLLPPQPGFFDLVVLDEAASIDQPLAVPAMLRGRRAVISGDPRQLRQVSFVSDVQMAAAIADAGLSDDPVLAARMDVRRNSVFDLAAGVTPAIVLNEHFRSDPHVIDFVARRLYGGRLAVATRRPTTQDRDCIDVARRTGSRDAHGVVRAEVETVLGLLRRSARERSVGVVTPFRAQADAIEKAVLAAFDASELEAMNLRVGTVHAFQGNERDIVIASLGVGNDNPNGWNFIEDPALASVLLTRARKRMIVVISGEPPRGGTIADYIAQENLRPQAPPSQPSPSSWADQISSGLEAAGLATTRGYVSGRHALDIALADSSRDVAVECDLHPDGVDSHIERRLDLIARGWDVRDAYRSRWQTRTGELVVELAEALAVPTTPAHD